MNPSIKEKYVILSIIGMSAGEKIEGILKRKINDINKMGFTFWVYKSNQASPKTVQDFCKKAKTGNKKVFCVFIEPSTPNGARPTKIKLSAKEFSVDNKKWKQLPKELGPVTGAINRKVYALKFNKIEKIDSCINLWNYADYLTKKAIKIRQGNSTLCAIKKNTNRELDKMKTPARRVIAVGCLHKPFCVWVR